MYRLFRPVAVLALVFWFAMSDVLLTVGATSASAAPPGSTAEGATLNGVGTAGYSLYRLQVAAGGYRCLAIWGREPFSKIHTTDACDPVYPEKQWYFEDVPGAPGYVWIRSVASGLCVVIQESWNGAPARQTTCDSRYADQHWWKIWTGNSGTPDYIDYYMLAKRIHGKCLVAPMWANYEPVQYDCNGDWSDQHWKLLYSGWQNTSTM